MYPASGNRQQNQRPGADMYAARSGGWRPDRTHAVGRSVGPRAAHGQPGSQFRGPPAT
jgi:hypothetical protein